MGLVTYKEDGFWSKPQFAFSSVFSGDGLVVVFQPPAWRGRPDPQLRYSDGRRRVAGRRCHVAGRRRGGDSNQGGYTMQKGGGGAGIKQMDLNFGRLGLLASAVAGMGGVGGREGGGKGGARQRRVEGLNGVMDLIN